MAARRKATKEVFRYANKDITETEEYKLSPRITLKKGDKIKVKGERGTFIFEAYVTNAANEASWINCYDKDQHRRSFNPDRIVRRVK